MGEVVQQLLRVEKRKYLKKIKISVVFRARYYIIERTRFVENARLFVAVSRVGILFMSDQAGFPLLACIHCVKIYLDCYTF